MTDYWKIRATKYNSLQWVNNKDNLKSLAKFSSLRPTQKVLEVGCGTGVVSKYIEPKVREMWAVDQSPDMLKLFPKDTTIKVSRLDLENEQLIEQFYECTHL